MGLVGVSRRRVASVARRARERLLGVRVVDAAVTERALVGARVAVTPNPFGGATIPVAISARTIHPHSFGSDAELHDTLRHASSTILRGEVAGS